MEIYKQKFTKLEIEIFSYICMYAGKKFSQRELAKYLKVSPTAIAKSINELINNNLINIEKVKTINFISFNRNNPKAIELKRVENLKNIYISRLNEYLEEELAGSCIIIFGSYSKGEDTINSDIDIAVIERKKKELKLKKYEEILNRKININYYNSFKNIHKNLKNNILNGIIITGSVNI
jgi:predicted nucleotidyltransferase